jgi:hypothetical protein
MKRGGPSVQLPLSVARKEGASGETFNEEWASPFFDNDATTFDEMKLFMSTLKLFRVCRSSIVRGSTSFDRSATVNAPVMAGDN